MRENKSFQLLDEAPHSNTSQSNETPVHKHSPHSYKSHEKWGGMGSHQDATSQTSRTQKLCQGPDQLQGCAEIPKSLTTTGGKTQTGPGDIQKNLSPTVGKGQMISNMGT